MKKTSMTLLGTALLSLSTVVGADRATSIEIKTTQTSPNHHRLYAGPDVFWSHFKSGLDKNNHGIDLNLDRNIYYAGLRFGYEYLEPNSFYTATDAVAALGADKARILQEKDEIAEHPKLAKRIRDTFHGRKGHFWGNIEQRFGYTFNSSLAPSCSVTWFAGPGFHYEHEKGANGNWWYLTTGLKAMQQFADHFHFGCDFKVMYAFGVHDENFLILPTALGKKTFWGYEVGLPFEWAVGKTQAFDIQLKPYLLKLNTDSPETILGARLDLGYNF